MKQRIIIATLLAALFCQSPRVGAQAVPAPPPAASGIVGLIGMLDAACKALKAKMCACPLGQLITNMGKPMNMAMGGLLCPPCCPPINPDDAKKPSTSPQGACAAIMQNEIDMPKRRKAIQCLARADCHWWPEAEAALITGLRTDQNECVRMEAALALGKGCCCTKKTIAALVIVVNSSKKDGNPSENSERVRSIAFEALKHCLACYVDEDTDPQKPETPKKTSGKKTPVEGFDSEREHLVFYDQLETKPSTTVLAEARGAMAALTRNTPNAPNAPNAPRTPAPLVPTGGQNFSQLWANAKTEPAPPAKQATALAQDKPRLQPIVQNTATDQRAAEEPRATLAFQEQ